MNNRRIATLAIAATCGMFVFSVFAVPPLYEAFCRITGFGGTPRQIEEVASEPGDRMIEIHFDANIDRALPWKFRPEKRALRVPVGKVVKIFYLAENRTDETTRGSALFNVVPDQSGYYFNKIDCFCFTDQILAPHEKARMPVVFRIDPAINDDSDLDEVTTITLSYKFYPLPAEGEE